MINIPFRVRFAIGAGLCLLLWWPNVKAKAVTESSLVFYEEHEIPSSAGASSMVQRQRLFAGDPGWHDSFAYHLLLVPQYFLEMFFYPVEKFIVFSEKVHLPSRLRDFFSNEDHTIFYYPSFMYSSDDGVAVGANYKNEHFLKRDHQLEMSAQLYANADHKVHVEYESPSHDYRRFFYEIESEYKRNSTARFYGIGNSTDVDDKSIFEEKRLLVDLDFGWHSPFVSRISMHGLVGYLNTDTDNGNAGNTRQKILDVFSESNLSGFGKTFEFVKLGPGFTYDTRNQFKNPWQGELIEATWTHYFPVSTFSEDFEFDAFYLRAVKLVPLATPRRVLAFGVEHRTVENFNQELPFQLLPKLGDNTRLRGYSSGRFRDRRTLVTSIEYRYNIWDTLLPHALYGLGTIFLDGGQVFNQWQEVELGEFHWGGGFGFVFGYRDSLLLRLQLAYGNEGLNTSVGVDHAF